MCPNTSMHKISTMSRCFDSKVYLGEEGCDGKLDEEYEESVYSNCKSFIAKYGSRSRTSGRALAKRIKKEAMTGKRITTPQGPCRSSSGAFHHITRKVQMSWRGCKMFVMFDMFYGYIRLSCCISVHD